jgi:hypothetical protein
MTLSPQDLTKAFERGATKILALAISVEFLPNSFGHIGTSKFPLTGLDLPVFKIDERPVIPSTSLKGAWRSRFERLLDENLDQLAGSFNTDPNHLKPCIPTTAPSVAERGKFGNRRWLTGCQIELGEEKVKLNPKHRDGSREFICPVCYFFGANGLQGFLRLSHLSPPVSQAVLYKQTITSRDRAVDGVRSGALASGEFVKGGTRFEGVAELLLHDGTFTFGDPRRLNSQGQDHEGKPAIVFDRWLENFARDERDSVQRQLVLINKLLIPAFEKIDVLGGHRSKGGGRVKVSIQLAPDTGRR